MSVRKNGFWTEENTRLELESVIDELGHFPINNELNKIGRSSLGYAISKNGGYNYFRDKLGYKLIRRHWDEKTIISTLNSIIDELSHFPTYSELNQIDNGDLVAQIGRNGGITYFRDKLGYKPLQKSNGYWTEENTTHELKLLIDELGKFPSQNKLSELGESSLAVAITKNGGFNYFREKMGSEPLRKSNGYWTEENIISTLNSIIDELGHFPTYSELKKIHNGDLSVAIQKHGGSNYFRDKLGYDIIHKPNGYWTKENTTSELNSIINELNHFPTHSELNKMHNGGLSLAIQKHGGSNYFMEEYGINPSIQEKHRSELASYINKRGYKTEQFVKNIITNWIDIHDKPAFKCNVKLSKGNVIEFVCDLDKKIGIDVTNTKASKPATYEQIRKKWRHKDYCLHLDELWIVVFTDVLTTVDYEKLNRRSPDNVKIFSIKRFLKELDYSTENMGKIDRLNECTFHNKEDIINPNHTFDEEYLSMSSGIAFHNT